MNSGRVVVGVSAVFALMAAVGFATTVFGVPAVVVPAGNQVCIGSQVIDDALVGIVLTNNSDSELVLDAASVDELDGIEHLGSWVIPATWNGDSIGATEYSTEAVKDYTLAPVEGAVIAPGANTHVVFRLRSAHGAGLATDFRFDLTGPYGVHHSVTSAFTAGFYSTDPEADENECGV